MIIETHESSQDWQGHSYHIMTYKRGTQNLSLKATLPRCDFGEVLGFCGDL